MDDVGVRSEIVRGLEAGLNGQVKGTQYRMDGLKETKSMGNIQQAGGV